MPSAAQSLVYLLVFALAAALSVFALAVACLAAASIWPLFVIYTAPDACRGMREMWRSWRSFIGAVEDTPAKTDTAPDNDN